MRLFLAEIQVENTQAKAIKLELRINKEDINGVLYYEGHVYIFELI